MSDYSYQQKSPNSTEARIHLPKHQCKQMSECKTVVCVSLKKPKFKISTLVRTQEGVFIW